jgi:hypothetical protein
MLGAVVANAVLVVVAALVVWYITSAIRRHRRGLVAERGLSIGADLGALADQPRVRVRAVKGDGAGHVLVVLTPAPGAEAEAAEGPDLEVLVDLRPDEFGYTQLQEWEQAQSVLGVVMPRGSHIMRLRGLDDLQPLTLRRVEKGPV